MLTSGQLDAMIANGEQLDVELKTGHLVYVSCRDKDSKIEALDVKA